MGNFRAKEPTYLKICSKTNSPKLKANLVPIRYTNLARERVMLELLLVEA